MTETKVREGDQVVHVDRNTLKGRVKGVHTETTAKAEQRDKSLLIEVLWDNGTLSYVAPEKLQVIQAPA